MKKAIYSLMFCFGISTALFSQNNKNATTIEIKPGILSGQLGVSGSGAATYILPIEVPQGRNGMTPSVALNYNSQSGDGILGQGWMISGWSYISRVPETKYHDGITQSNGAVDFMADGFDLDGNRLIKVANNEYRTEIDGISRIKSFNVGKSMNSLGGFTVETKGGLKKYYGSMPDGSNDNGNQVWGAFSNPAIRYHLVKEEDQQGNYIAYTYLRSATEMQFGELYLDEIRYTGKNGGNSPYYSIKFEYDNSLLASEYYKTSYFQYNNANKYSYRVSRVLKYVKLLYMGQEIKRYILNYTSGGNPHLSSVQVLAGNSTLNSTQFTWTGTNSNYTNTTNINNTSGLVTVSNHVDCDKMKYVRADFDGDNRPEIVESGTWSGTLTNLISGTYIRMGANTESIKVSDTYGTPFAIDINGDGIDELFIGNAIYKVVISAGVPSLSLYSSPTTSMEIKNIGDYNGDQRQDIIYKVGRDFYLRLGIDDINQFYNSNNQFLVNSYKETNTQGSFIGDSRQQLACINIPFKSISIYEIIPDGTNYKFNECFIKTGVLTADNESAIIDAGDFNGDGKADLLLTKYSPNNPISSRYSTMIYYCFGAGFTDPNVLLNFPDYYTNQYTITDINSDGLSDVLYYNLNLIYNYPNANINTNIYKLLKKPGIDAGFIPNTGETKINTVDISNLGLSHLFPPHFIVGEFNNTGICDLFVSYTLAGLYEDPFHVAAAQRYLFLNKDADNNISNDVITRIVDGFGNSTSISYTHPTRYQTAFANPVIEANQPINVVNEIIDENNQKLTYSFETLLLHQTGRGVLGFKKTTVSNTITNTKTLQSTDIFISNGLYYFPYIKTTEVYQLSGYTGAAPILSRQNVSFDVKLTNSGYSKVYIPVITQTLDCAWDNDGTYMGCKINLQSVNDIDIYGNSLKSVSIADETAYYYSPGSDYSWVKTITTSYKSADITKWIVSLPSTQLEQNYHKQEETTIPANIYSYTLFNYYTNQSQYYPLLQSKEVFPNSTYPDNSNIFKIVAAYEYDSYGNATKITQSVPYDTYANPPRIKMFNYKDTDNYLGRFLTTSTLVAGSDAGENQVSTYVYDLSKGSLLSETDANDLTTSYVYDDFGSLNKTIFADGTSNEVQFNWSNQMPDGSATSLYAKYSFKNLVSGSDKWDKSVEYYDKYQRLVRTVSYPLFPTSGTPTVYVDYVYDNFGRLWMVSEPFVDNKKAAVKWSTTTYDALSRKKTETKITGAVEEINYSGRKTRITNNNTSVWTETTKNAIGLPDITNDPTNATINNNYDPAGRVRSVYTYGSTIPSRITYDNAGNQTGIIDVDAGNISRKYDAYGQLRQEIDSRNNKTVFTYDIIGRPLLETVENGNAITSYTYNLIKASDIGGFGKINIIQKLNSGSNTGSGGTNIDYYKYFYDSKGRIYKRDESVAGGTIRSFKYTFSTLNGAVDTYEYPSGFKLQYSYNGNGELTKILDANNTTVKLWQALSANILGQLTSFKLGNNLTTLLGFDQYGFPVSIQTSNSVQNCAYSFDAYTGNLTYKTETVNGVVLREDYSYDNLLKSRLISWQVQGQSGYTIQYANNGNIQSKTDISSGTYSYHSTKIHAVASITSPVSAYFSLPRPTVRYDGSNMAKSIRSSSNNDSIKIFYGPDGNRIKSIEYSGLNGSIIKTKVFHGDYEIITNNVTNVTSELSYLEGPSGLFAIVVKTAGVNAIYYIHSDYLGSYNVISNATGTKVENLSFDPWGRRRNPNNWSFTGIPIIFLFDRGYTGHEHLDKYNLINMNARLYDPYTGRFLSPDPQIQATNYGQNYNRYTYALNNPLKYTDPDGEFWHLLFGAAIGGVTNWVAHGAEFSWKGLGYFGVGAAAGALAAGVGAGVSSALAGGTFGAGFLGTTAAGMATASFQTGFVIGGLAGATNGFVSGAGNSLMQGNKFIDAIGNGIKQSAIQGVSGAFIGGISLGIIAEMRGNNFWTGIPRNPIHPVPNFNRLSLTSPSAKMEISIQMKAKLNPIYTDSKMYFDGNTIDFCDFYCDGSSSVRITLDAVSGAGGSMSLPNGNYMGTNLRLRTLPTMTRDGVGFSMDLNDAWDPVLGRMRTALRIHPDGQAFGNWWLNNGTDGCIGLQGNAEGLRNFYNIAKAYLDRHSGIINLLVAN